MTKSYLDPLAVRIQSVRFGQEGRGWRRFLVFAALTKGRKGAEYVALFTYFTFEGERRKRPIGICELTLLAWLRIVFAEGPRQVINALTLYSVLNAKLIPVGHNAAKDGHSPVAQFFLNVSILAGQDRQQAVVLLGMLYTLIIWVISAFSLIMAVLFYLLFLWHHIPSADGTLSKYCKRKIEKRLHKIVMATVNKALDKQDMKRAANDLAKPGFLGTATNDVKRQPTLPNMDDENLSMSRRTTQSDFVPFPSRPSISSGIGRAPSPLRGPTLPDVGVFPKRPDIPSRQTTQSSVNSNTSHASNVPLLSSTGDMGYGGQASADRFALGLGREFLGHSDQSQERCQSRRQNTDMSGAGIPSFDSNRSQSRPSSPHGTSSNQFPQRSAQPTFNQVHRPMQEYEMRPPRSASAMSSRTVPLPASQPFVPYRPYKPGPQAPAARNFTNPQRTPFGSRPDLPQRSETAPLPELDGYHESIIDVYSSEEPTRLHPTRPHSFDVQPGGHSNTSHNWTDQPRRSGV